LSPASGGPYESIRHLTGGLAEADVDVAVAMPFDPVSRSHHGEWRADMSSEGRILFPPLGWSPDFARRVLAQDADILHTHGLWQHPSWVALGWKRQRQRPHVVSVRGMLEPWAWEHRAWKKRPMWKMFEKRNLESAALLHATSEQEAQSFRDRGLKVPIAIIPNGVELPDKWIRNGVSMPSKRTVLFLSRIHPKKGLPLLLEAWAKVRPDGWDLKIVGPDEGGHRKELEKQAAALGLADVVSFLDAVRGEEAKNSLFTEASLFVLPTHSENFGIAVAEAMAHGLPVITTHGAPWQILEEEQCGWWVPVSVDGLAAALDAATRLPPEKLEEMGIKGRYVVADRFGWDGIARRFIDCYRWLLGQGPRPDVVIH
jgi:glycosyltransferase involved in cell wall biosynthesis